MIDITLIGTGALQPLPGRALASAAITIAGRTLLLDCGEGTQSAARAAGISLLKIDAIALTHYHGDHTYGLPGLLQSLGMAERTEPVRIFGPAGLEDEMKPFQALCPFLPFELYLQELPSEGIMLSSVLNGWPENVFLKPFATSHRVPSQGYRLELRRPGRFLAHKAKELGVPVTSWKLLQRGVPVQAGDRLILPQQVLDAPRRGLTVAYTGDTAMCGALLTGTADADLLICEATYAENEQADRAQEHGHMTFAQAAMLAGEAAVRELWLTHYSPMIDDPSAYESNASAIFSAVRCGRDGMRTALRFDENSI